MTRLEAKYKKEIVPDLLKKDCPALGVGNQLSCPGMGCKKFSTIVRPLKPETAKFVPNPRAANSNGNWPNAGVLSVLLNRS